MTGIKRAFLRLPSLPRSLPVHFLLADINRSVLPETAIVETVAQISHATTSRLKGAGHLLVQEDPKGTARVLGEVLEKWFPRTLSEKL
jgi:pimeloyl-ACP methyl ester carboxylesterase